MPLNTYRLKVNVQRAVVHPLGKAKQKSAGMKFMLHGRQGTSGNKRNFFFEMNDC